jgi:flagellar biosynthesis protein FlhF
LCLPAPGRRADTAAAFEGYRSVGADSIILTKWDETRVPGESLSFVIEQGLPLSHSTLGQDVPDDIVDADAAAIAASALATDEHEMEVLL